MGATQTHPIIDDLVGVIATYAKPVESYSLITINKELSVRYAYRGKLLRKERWKYQRNTRPNDQMTIKDYYLEFGWGKCTKITDDKLIALWARTAFEPKD